MNVVIIGAGGQGQVVRDIIISAGAVKVAGFIDNNPELKGQKINGLPVLGDLSVLDGLAKNGINGAIVAIGDNGLRSEIAARVRQAGLELVNAVHPSAVVCAGVSMGVNNVIAAGAIICTGVVIGNDVIINTGAIIEHENIIEDGVHISPGAKTSGRVTVKSCAHIGVGAVVIQNLTVHENAVVGAGAVVLKDVPAGTTVAGVPARPIRSHTPKQV